MDGDYNWGEMFDELMRRPLLYMIDEEHRTWPCEAENFTDQPFDLKRVDNTKLRGCIISTVFLAVDHNMFGQGPPVLFETMVFPRKLFGGRNWREVGSWQCCTWDQAVAQHDQIVCKMRDEGWDLPWGWRQLWQWYHSRKRMNDDGT